MAYDITDYVAWWGAIVATSVLVWDIYKALSAKPVIMVRTRAIVSPDHRLEIEIANVGSKGTTLTDVYTHAGAGIQIEPDGPKSATIPSGGPRLRASFEDRFSLPFRLEPGYVWWGEINPANVDHIDGLDSIILKARDEHGVKIVRYEASVPSQWREQKRRRRQSTQ